MRFFIAILILGIPFFFAECRTDKYSKQIQMLDSLQIDLEREQAVFSQADTLKIDSLLGEFKNRMNELESQIKDTLEKKEMNSILEFRDLAEPLLFIRNNSGQIQLEVKTSITQIKKLKEDLLANRIQEAEAFEYFSQEKTYASQLIRALKQNNKIASRNNDRFIALNEQVKSILEKRNEKQN